MKKETKALFSAIGKQENAAVHALLAENPDLVNARASAPPKKDDGQSPLQVAFKTGNFEIAAHLIDLGSDIHYMEQSELNEWRAPILHDALRAAVFNARERKPADRDHFTTAITLVRRMLELGADPKDESRNLLRITGVSGSHLRRRATMIPRTATRTRSRLAVVGSGTG